MSLCKHRPALLLAGLALSLLAACGGADPEADTPAARSTVSSATPPAAATAVATPTDTGARTRAGRYLTPAQAARIEAAMGVMAIPVRVEPADDPLGAIELATLVFFGLQAAHDLRPDAPVLVNGSDLRLAASAANRLEEIGFSRVYLVTR